MKEKMLKAICIILILFLIALIYMILVYTGIITPRYYTNEDFGMEEHISINDVDKDGIDDYTDILLGAREDAINKPTYDGSSYYAGGYPPDDIGVCTDVIWRALQNAGYNIKDAVDEDILNNIELYPAVTPVIDSNIDFRRVRNLKVFMDRHLTVLTNDIYDIESWQAGDIVIFGKNYTHIGIISDKRNERGIPYLIHNSGQPNREEDILEVIIKFNEVTGHYRVDNSF